MEEIIPVNSPDAAISFRVFGWVANWLNVSSPLMGADSVCFSEYSPEPPS